MSSQRISWLNYALPPSSNITEWQIRFPGHWKKHVSWYRRDDIIYITATNYTSCVFVTLCGTGGWYAYYCIPTHSRIPVTQCQISTKLQLLQLHEHVQHCTMYLFLSSWHNNPIGFVILHCTLCTCSMNTAGHMIEKQDIHWHEMGAICAVILLGIFGIALKRAGLFFCSVSFRYLFWVIVWWIWFAGTAKVDGEVCDDRWNGKSIPFPILLLDISDMIHCVLDGDWSDILYSLLYQHSHIIQLECCVVSGTEILDYAPDVLNRVQVAVVWREAQHQVTMLFKQTVHNIFFLWLVNFDQSVEFRLQQSFVERDALLS